MINEELILPIPKSTEFPKINGKFFSQDILSLDQFDPISIDLLFNITVHMGEIARNAKVSNYLAGNIATLLFYEPSTRTRGSFDAATKQLGGQTIVVENPQQFSSVAKGETFGDTIKTFEAYCDLIILRHPEVGAAQKAAKAAEFVPIINAGDGIGEHPTQALLDLYTIFEKKHTLSGKKGLIVGDIKNGRTIHSLLRGLSLFKNNTVYLLSPEQLKLQRPLLEDLSQKGLKIFEISQESEIPRDCDFWYWTRVQKERFQDQAEFERLKHSFIATPQLLQKYGNDEMILMHPLPRVGEISEEVDSDPRAVYLRNQIRNGMYIRMALLGLVLGKIPARL